MLASLVNLIAPLECLICGNEGDVICATCLPRAVAVKTPTCYRCNRLSSDGRTCNSCRSSSKLSGVLVASHYEGPVKQAITKLKYENLRAAAGSLAKLVTPLLSGEYDVITSVPPATNRLRQRGFDHGALIARAVAAASQIPYRPLLRRAANIQQVGKSREQRLAQARGVFTYRKPLNDQRVLIIDDVVTTGATLAACTSELKAAGAKSVWAAVAAKH
ncbi:MAG TPA: phosphoribosyltransferase family protein [Candidatus Saccharimonadales bacterium]|nr:phosphoribosyltransferase family protein [Candidatus Saccharimonadales bacterium]